MLINYLRILFFLLSSTSSRIIFLILTLFGVTVIVGYVGSIIFSKTKIPDLIWLIVFGFAAASFGFADRALFLSIAPFLAALAILLILFDSGLNLDFYQMLRGFPRSMVLAFLGMVLSTAGVAVFAMYFLEFTLSESLLLCLDFFRDQADVWMCLQSGF